MEIRFATRNMQTALIEGPSAAQAKRMAAHRLQLLAEAQQDLEAGNDDRAFSRDCAAWDIERDLLHYGFNLNGNRAKR